MSRDDFVWRHWDRIDRILEGALALAPRDRAAFLERACSGDPPLRSTLDALLEAAASPDAHLEGPRDRFLEEAFLGESGLGGDEGSLPADTLVDRYRIVKEMGRGGMATVYEARRDDGVFSRTVALKILRRGLDTEDVLRRFHEEREILAGLDHPSIARILDGGSTEDGRPWFAMERVDGEPITQWAEARDLDVHGRLDLFLQVAEAVRSAHGRLVIHCDIKPSNVLVDGEGRVKLLDFGIARVLTPDRADTRLTRGIIMTPAYASPEQARGERLSTVSDVYQLGLLLFELLTASSSAGMEPRRTTDTDSRRRPSAVAARLGRPRLAASLRGDLDTIVGTALREDPADRYGSVEALIRDLVRHREGRPIEARRASLLYVTRKFASRNRRLVAAASLLAFLSLGYVATLVLQSRRIALERDRANDAAERAEALRGFLVDQFGAADPWAASGAGADEVTMVEALDAAAEHARIDLRTRPALLAEILSDVASVYENLDRPTEAIDLVSEAIGIRESIAEGESMDQLDDLGALTLWIGDVGLADSARVVGARRLSLERTRPNPDPLRIASALNALGRVESAQARYELADSLFREALLLMRSGPPDPRDLAAVLESRSFVLQQMEDLEGAEAAVREALQIRSAIHDADHPSVAVTEVYLAQLLYARGEFQPSADLFARALASLERTLGPDHSTTMATLSNMGIVLDALGDFEGAAAVHRRLLTRRRADAGGAPSAQVGTSMQNLATTLLRLGRLGEADSLAAEAGGHLAAAQGARHFTVGFTQLTRSEIALMRGDGGRAVIHADSALSILREVLPEGHFAVSVGECRRAGGLALLGRYDEAAQWGRPAFEAIAASAVAGDRRAAECASTLSGIYRARSDAAGVAWVEERMAAR